MAGIPQIILPQALKGNYSSWHIYVIRTANSADRDKLANFLKNKGIGVNFHYPAVYSHPYYRKNGYNGLKLVNEEIYQNSCITLPCYVNLAEKEIKFIGGSIKKYFMANEKKSGKNEDQIEKIMGERVYLRKLISADTSPDYCSWLNDREVNKYLETRKKELILPNLYIWVLETKLQRNWIR